MEKLSVEKINVNFNYSGDYFVLKPNLTKEFNNREEAIEYINSETFYDELLDILEEDGEETDDGFEPYSEMSARYGASIDITLGDEEIYGDIYVRYERRKGYVIDEIEYDYE